MWQVPYHGRMCQIVQIALVPRARLAHANYLAATGEIAACDPGGCRRRGFG